MPNNKDFSVLSIISVSLEVSTHAVYKAYINSLLERTSNLQSSMNISKRMSLLIYTSVKILSLYT